MRILQNLRMDLARCGCKPIVGAVQGEANTRVLVISLFDNGVAWEAPAGATAAVAFSKPDGHKGLYDTLPDGTPATSINGSVVTITLAPQVLTTAGEVLTSVVFNDAELDQLATFPFRIRVEPNPAAGEQISNGYYKYTTMGEINRALGESCPAIICEESGSIINLNDSSDRLLQGLTLYGKTTQDGTPAPEAPVELVKAGASGSIVSTITDGTDSNVQTVTAQTPNGLPGIPAESGGNYTDENGQQWICDEIDFARGVYVQRVRELDFATFNWKATSFSNDVQKGYYAKVNGFYNSRNNFFHTHYRWLGFTVNSGSGTNAVGSSQTAFNARKIGEIGFCSKTDGQDYFGVVVGINDGTPVGTLQLVCVEPIETPLSAEELAQYADLHTNKPETTVYNDAGAGMKIAYVADTKLYIDKKLAEISAAMLNA